MFSCGCVLCETVLFAVGTLVGLTVGLPVGVAVEVAVSVVGIAADVKKMALKWHPFGLRSS